MLLLTVHNNIANELEDSIKAIDVAYTRNGNQFEIPAADPIGFLIGRRYQEILKKYNSGEQIQAKENSTQG